MRGPRTSNFDQILTWGCVRRPNRSEPSSFCIASANTALREARQNPRFGHIWQVVAGADSGERGGRYALYRHTESAISMFWPPVAQFTMKSTFLKGSKFSLIKVVVSVFFLGGCVQGTCRVPHPKGVLSQTPLGWVESIERGFQSLNPRSWWSSRRLRGCR